MQSAAKAPYLLMFEVERWDGPDSAVERIDKFIKETSGMTLQTRPSTRRRDSFKNTNVMMVL